MFFSLIISTKDRAAQLAPCLKEMVAAAAPDCEAEVVLVDNGSTDATKAVFEDFAAKTPLKTTYTYCEIPGLGRARNAGLAVAKGEWLLFTDDDCYVEPMYFRNFHEFTTAVATATNDAKDIRYGGSSVLLYDDDHDPRIANITIDTLRFIPPKTLLQTGIIQGANMFFHRSVFDKVGPFKDNMGAGTPFACEDIEMAQRSSLAGFVGALVPFFKVTHHHRRMRGSQEANSVVTGYDYGRGAYYAALLDSGVADVWKLWAASAQMDNFKHPSFRVRLIREFEGAANYLKSLR